jgi:LAO/AO transport system kinase
MQRVKNIARNISIIENHIDGYKNILLNLDLATIAPVIGFTGPPGAGKSTLVDELISCIVKRNKTVAVLCVDPSSAFNMGALLGDRIRMSRWYTHDKVFIRSLASRKELGGLCPMIIEITEYLKTVGFDFVIVETVGVGQTEIEVAGIADITVACLVPESGDEIQTMKAGLMEIADIFVVNKSDKPGADTLVKNLHSIFPITKNADAIPIVKTIANVGTGVDELYNVIEKKIVNPNANGKRAWLFAEKAYHLIQMSRMKDIDKQALYDQIKEQTGKGQAFNLYRFVQSRQTEIKS